MYAQSTSTANTSNGFHFGVRAGLNLANITKTNNDNFSTALKPGFNAAAFVELPIANGFNIQPELQFAQKGYKTTGTYLINGNYEYNVTTNYVEVPLLAKFSPSKFFAIVLGPQYSFLTSTKINFTSGSATYNHLVEEDNNNLKKNILGGVVGVEATASNIVFAARYNLDFQQNNGDGSSITPKYKNQVIALSIGVRF
ncbi:MAG: porin family protein [Flavobacterium sp.]|nr:porin family protein [Flavobacterium sp.]